MADWNTHLYCAYRVNETLGFEGRDLDMFLYGSLLPDINLGWLIKPEVRLEQADTHFDAVGQEYFWAPARFCDKYPEQIKARDPLFLGYLFHLWLDVAIMTDFVSKVPMSEMIGRRHEVREWKWKDMAMFIKEHHYSLSTANLKEIAERAALIEEIRVTEPDLLKAADFVENVSAEFESDRYYLYTGDELSQFFEKTCRDFVRWAGK